MMAEARDDEDEIFVYMGGDQEVPRHVRRARIHRSVESIPARAFYCRYQLISVEFHDEIETVEESAFSYCYSLRGPIKLLGVKIVKPRAFLHCSTLTGVEFGDMLETIEARAFNSCKALRNIAMPSVRIIGERAFAFCYEISGVECGEDLETIQEGAFDECPNLRRLVLPLKHNMIEDNIFGVFDECPQLATVDLAGGIRDTVASLHMESWRIEMINEINRINQVLPNIDDDEQKTGAIQQWIRSVIQQLSHYKAEHSKILTEATTLLELVLWKANLDGNEGGEKEGVRTTRGSRKRARKEICVTSGASIVIRNVLPFLVLK